MFYNRNTALTERYPEMNALPVAAIGALPTPLERVRGSWLDEMPLGELWIKRDDLTSPEYGGNKVRKLGYLLGDALSKNATSVLTFGAYGSNHALATAVHARARGMEPHAVLSPQEPTPYASATLLAHAALGTVLHPTDGWDGRHTAVLASGEIERQDGIGPYVIPMGGTNTPGVLGFVDAALELARQIAGDEGGAREQGSAIGEFDAVYVAAGTLGTAVGIALGLAAVGITTRVEAILVTPPEIACEDVARRLVADAVSALGSLVPDFPRFTYDDLSLTLRREYLGPGYGLATPEAREAVELAAECGYQLETTYTGKAFAALIGDARSGNIGPGDRVLFWNTYSSASKLEPGPVEALPLVLRDYIAECERLFGASC
jgi:1-aminocyclopropane-1-carboxylate deaminase/D-cysteine desulfhydrase-like pyridoxal-dependent ACC family enzyme